METAKNPTTTSEKKRASISERAMLVTLNMGGWNYKVRNRKVASEVEQSKQARHGTCRVDTLLVSKEVLAKVEKIRGAARTYLYGVSAPWRHGVRLVSSQIVFDVRDELRQYKAKFMDAVEEFMDGYDAVLADAPQRLKHLFNAKDFPSKEALRSKFYFSVRMSAIPDAEHIMVKLSEEAIDEIRGEMLTEQEEALADAMSDVWKRIHTFVKHMSETLASDNNNFHTSLVGNVLDFAKSIPVLNFSGDEELDQLKKEIEFRLTKFNSASAFRALKEDDALRSEAQREANNIAKKIGQYL